MDLVALAVKYPKVIALMAKYPAVKGLAYLLDKSPADLDLDDLRAIGKVFVAEFEPTQAHVDTLREVLSKTDPNSVFDMIQSPQAIAKVVGFFTPSVDNSVIEATDAFRINHY